MYVYVNIFMYIIVYIYICACVCLEMGYPISGKPQEMYIDVACQPLKKNIPISDVCW